MIANYHTHTYRCKHATGGDEAYVRAAIDRGLHCLGFSDHTPMPFAGGEQHTAHHRMAVADLPGYVASLLALREKYRGQIELLIGLEVEYYPTTFPALLALLRTQPIDYIILGQHFLGNEEEGLPPCLQLTDRADYLAQYVDYVCAGMETGYFSYLAHPDVLHYTGDEACYDREMRRLCMAAKRLDIPLEINLYGLSDGRHYPRPSFWQIAAECGNTAILGCDAHTSARVAEPREVAEGEAFAARYHLPLLSTLPLRSLR